MNAAARGGEVVRSLCRSLTLVVWYFIVPQEYLASAVNHLEEDSSRTSVNEIRGIWVASDDMTMVDEVRTLAHTYFPNVSGEAIVCVAGGVPGGVETSGVFTHTNQQVLIPALAIQHATAPIH